MLRDEFNWMDYLKKDPMLRHRERNIGSVENPYFIMEDTLPGLLNDGNVIQKINMYVISKKWGLPFAGGWMEQPAWIMEIFNVLDDVEVKYGKRTTNR